MKGLKGLERLDLHRDRRENVTVQPSNHGQYVRYKDVAALLAGEGERVEKLRGFLIAAGICPRCGSARCEKERQDRLNFPDPFDDDEEPALNSPAQGEEACERCSGSGFKTSRVGPHPFYNTDLPCPDCHGTGKKPPHGGDEGLGLREALSGLLRELDNYFSGRTLPGDELEAAEEKARAALSQDSEEKCELCEGEGQVAKNFGINSPGRPEIVPCPDCTPTHSPTDAGGEQ